MNSSSTSKIPCIKDGCKSVGILKCEGCCGIFCREHVDEHRNALSYQLDEIVQNHDSLQQLIIESDSEDTNHQSVLEEIDRWEKDSISIVQRMAQKTREQIKLLFSSKQSSSNRTRMHVFCKFIFRFNNNKENIDGSR